MNTDSVAPERRVEIALETIWIGANAVDTFDAWYQAHERCYGMAELAYFFGHYDAKKLCRAAADQAWSRALFTMPK